MKQVEVRKELARARAGLYRFLGGLYIMEVDEETLANMKQMQFPTDCANEELAEAYRGLEKAIADLNNEDLEDVAADYAKTFLAAGEATGAGQSARTGAPVLRSSTAHSRRAAAASGGCRPACAGPFPWGFRWLRIT